MAILQCKMCGGALKVIESKTVTICGYCGTQQTLPRLDNDKRIHMFDRANQFRRNNEYDKATVILEQILAEDNTDCEAYWALVLCHYGVEYVEDPQTHRRVPTVNRTQKVSVFDNPDYKLAMRYANGYQQSIYSKEAQAINQIQNGILALSSKEKPFDVFICYKETDHFGRRTEDSVIANSLYNELEKEGLRVFFARITLEDKLGTAYEPYIFSALNSAKVMVVVGTKKENFEAPWVKNEWSRYLKLMRIGEDKVLIPAYKNIKPEELPPDFSHLQAQDMTKLGYMQDLVRGIKKIIGVDKAQQTEKTVQPQIINGNTDALFKRGYMALEDKEWRNADKFFDQVLNIDAENGEAYLGKLLAGLRVQNKDDLVNARNTFSANKNYEKICRFGDKELVDWVNECNLKIETRIETDKKEKIYVQAVEKMKVCRNEGHFRRTAELFGRIEGYKNAGELKNICILRANSFVKDEIYRSALAYMSRKDSPKNMMMFYIEAKKLFDSIPGWRDSDARSAECIRQIQAIRMDLERRRR